MNDRALGNQPTIDICESAIEPADQDEISWRDRAACRDLDTSLFFPDEGDYVGVEKAKQFCAACPVSWECFSYAVWTNPSAGIWGGTTPDERRRFRRLL